jgi:hypothetical protein
MKVFALAILLLVALDVQAQAVTTGGKAKVMTSNNSTLTITDLDTIQVGVRYATRMGLKYTQAQLDSAKASVICPPGGCTAADSARIDRRGQNRKPTQVIFQGPDSTYILK